VSLAEPLLEAPIIVQTIKEAGLVLCTYGLANNDLTNVELQERLGVDAVIVDRVVSIAKRFTQSPEPAPSLKTLLQTPTS